MMAAPVSAGHANDSVQRRRRASRERAAAGTTGSSRKTAAKEKLLAERVRRVERRLPETMRVARQRQSQVLKACLARRQERSAATPKHLRWRGYSRDDEHSNHTSNSTQPGKGCRAGKVRGRNKSRSAIAALHSAHENEWTDTSRCSYDDSRTARRGQEDARRRCRLGSEGRRWGPEPGVHRSPRWDCR
jgi:hypothetical protein